MNVMWFVILFALYFILDGIYLNYLTFKNRYGDYKTENPNVHTDPSEAYVLSKRLSEEEKGDAYIWLYLHQSQVTEFLKDDLEFIFGSRIKEYCQALGVNLAGLRRNTPSPEIIFCSGSRFDINPLIYNLWLSHYGKFDFSQIQILDPDELHLALLLKILQRIEMNMGKKNIPLRFVLIKNISRKKQIQYEDFKWQSIAFSAAWAENREIASRRLWEDDLSPRYIPSKYKI